MDSSLPPAGHETQRPPAYQYVEILKKHLGGSFSAIFSRDPIYPRQLEVHLPANHNVACDFSCFYCQGGALRRDLAAWEETGLRLVDALQGRIPYHIYGGAYTEPLLNRYLQDFLRMTKKYGNNFGIHTNGSQLLALQSRSGLLSELVALSDGSLDYVSISLDAGTVASHQQTKNIGYDAFTSIVQGIRDLVRLRGAKTYPIVRVCYLVNRFNCSPDELAGVVRTMKHIGVDSLRFSVPYDLYGKSFREVRHYRNTTEASLGKKCAEILRPFLTMASGDKTQIFWHPPSYQDVEKMRFRQCIYSYYQITLGADGYVYRCSSTASPSFSGNRLGKITDDPAAFEKTILANHDALWNARSCFAQGARCNRIALELNDLWNTGRLL